MYCQKKCVRILFIKYTLIDNMIKVNMDISRGLFLAWEKELWRENVGLWGIWEMYFA